MSPSSERLCWRAVGDVLNPPGLQGKAKDPVLIGRSKVHISKCTSRTFRMSPVVTCWYVSVHPQLRARTRPRWVTFLWNRCSLVGRVMLWTGGFGFFPPPLRLVWNIGLFVRCSQETRYELVVHSGSFERNPTSLGTDGFLCAQMMYGQVFKPQTLPRVHKRSIGWVYRQDHRAGDELNTLPWLPPANPLNTSAIQRLMNVPRLPLRFNRADRKKPKVCEIDHFLLRFHGYRNAERTLHDVTSIPLI